MTPKELITYIENRNLEYQMVNILMYNELDFSFMPIIDPKLIINESEKDSFEVIGFDDFDLFANGYRGYLFKITPDLRNFRDFNRLVFHPENIKAYAIRQGKNFGVELIYSRKRDCARLLRNAAFETFMAFNNLSTIDQFMQFYEQSEVIRKNKYKRGIGLQKDFRKYLIDEAFSESVKKAGENLEKVYLGFTIRLYGAHSSLFSNRFALTNFIIEVEDTVAFFAEYKPIPPIKTNLAVPISIIDDEDEIPDILYRLSYDMKASTLYIATGYLYDSGLARLLPVIDCMDNKIAYEVELIVGDLYHYAKGRKCKSPNRATISSLNYLRDSSFITKLFTHSSKFYHGKFYYISNGKISYVIMGSSNVTISAYQKNKEFDIVYRFERKDGVDPLEQAFLDWYKDLKSECIELNAIDESLFPSNLNIDEEGNSYSNALLKSITSEEEQQRFEYLLTFSPSKVEADLFKGKLFKPFKNYMLFIFPERGISLLEGFTYGNSCYAFSSTNIEVIRNQICMKSKELVRQSDLFLTDIPHDDKYQDVIRSLLH